MELVKISLEEYNFLKERSYKLQCLEEHLEELNGKYLKDSLNVEVFDEEL